MSMTEQYRRMVEQEDSYLEQIATVDMCVNAILDYTYRSKGAFDRIGVKDVLETVHEIELGLRRDLLLLRLEKAMLALKLKG